MNTKTQSRSIFLLTVGLVIALLAGCGAPASMPVQPTVEPTPATTSGGVDAEIWDKFEAELESLRQQMKIPGMSAAVVKDGQLVWARGLGYADIEKNVPATPETPYQLASVTKPFAALVIMQLVQEGKLSLDDPVSRYGVNLPEGDKVLVRHLMSHTSAGTPGAFYLYDGARYALLSQVVQAATGRSWQDWLYERILQPLDMQDTAPNLAGCAGLSFAPACERAWKALAQPYQLDENLNFIPGYYPPGFSAAAGLISTVIDLVRFDAALDANSLVPQDVKELMWTPTVSNSGQKLPYGLGWFTQSYRGTRLIWHYGYEPPSTSALFLKLPEERLTFIVLANTDGLSRPVPWNKSDVLDSLVALAFYKQFVLEPNYGQPLPTIDWSADSSTLITLISNVEDESVRDILSKEFAARRTLATSLAQVKQQARLEATKRARERELAESIDPKILDAYAGRYQFPDGVIVTIRVDGRRIFSRAPNRPEFELFARSENQFYPREFDAVLTFYRNDKGEVDRMAVQESGETYEAKKVP